MTDNVTSANLAEIVPYMKYLIVFVIAVMVVLWVVSIYFMKKGTMSIKEWSKRSLGLPQGSVRALLAFVILFLVVAAVIIGKDEFPDLPDWLVGILGAVVGFYFGAATVAKPPEPPTKPEGGTTETTGETPPPKPPS